MAAPAEALTRHDRRRLTEAYLGVQASASEVAAYLRELVAPSDGTSEEVVEVLTRSAIDDVHTLERALAEQIDVVVSLRGYEQLYGAANERDAQRSRTLELMRDVRVFVERLLVKAETRQFAEGAALAADEANAVAERTRELDALARRVAVSFGFRDGSSLADDDASSSEDSGCLPEDDNHGDFIDHTEDGDKRSLQELLRAYGPDQRNDDGASSSDAQQDEGEEAANRGGDANPRPEKRARSGDE